jgi:glycerol-3-phosphate dehydrogenase
VHGGVRYLEKAVREFSRGQYRLVREALLERKHVVENAPHLAWVSNIVLPCASTVEQLYYRIGLGVYDWVAGSANFRSARAVGRAYLQEYCQAISAQAAPRGVVFHDGQFYDTEYALALARSAARAGATVRNHTKLVGVEPLPDSVLTHLVDTLTGESWSIRARAVVNCTGPASDRLRQLFDPAAAPRLRPSKGIHIVVRNKDCPLRDGLLLPSSDGRVVFALPWYGHVVIGTTDTETRDPHAPPQPEEPDIEFLLREVNRLLATPLNREQVCAAWAGNRPLVAAARGAGARTEALIRNHELEVWPERRVIHVLGGKWTTYRQMAEEATDALETLLATRRNACTTRTHALVGAPPAGEAIRPLGVSDFPTLHRAKYGTELAVVEQFERQAPDLLVPSWPFTVGELQYHLAHTQARTPEDLIDRRLRIGYLNQDVARALMPFAQKVLGSA